MTGEDKQIIYNLLRTASRNLYGYTTKAFESAQFKSVETQTSAPVEVNIQAVTASSIPNPTTVNQINQIQNKPDFVPDQKAEQPAGQSVEPKIEPKIEQKIDQKIPASETKSETSGITLGDVILKIARCTHCALARTRSNVVPGTGVKKPEVLVIGDGPSREDNMSGLPFSGPAGQLLDKMLGAIRLERTSNCYLTNVIKCAAPQNRDPYPEETEACAGFLEAQIKVLKPNMILCTGRVAAVTLLKNDQSVNLSLPIDQLHGKWFQYNGTPVFIIHNPEEVLRNQALKKPVWDDLRSFAAKLKEISPAYAALFN